MSCDVPWTQSLHMWLTRQEALAETLDKVLAIAEHIARVEQPIILPLFVATSAELLVHQQSPMGPW